MDVVRKSYKQIGSVVAERGNLVTAVSAIGNQIPPIIIIIIL